MARPGRKRKWNVVPRYDDSERQAIAKFLRDQVEKAYNYLQGIEPFNCPELADYYTGTSKYWRGYIAICTFMAKCADSKKKVPVDAA